MEYVLIRELDLDRIYSLRSKLTNSDFKLIADIVWNQKLTDSEVGRFSMEPSSIDWSLDDTGLKQFVDRNKKFDKVSLALYLYVTNRYILLKNGITNRDICDYVSNFLYEFSIGRRYMKISRLDDENYHYLTDILNDIRESKDFRQFLLSQHLGNYALWRSGLFNNVDEQYYTAMGQMGYKMAAINPQAKGCQGMYYELSENFSLILKSLREFAKGTSLLGDGQCH